MGLHKFLLHGSGMRGNRRRSSVFRAMLLAASMKVPDDPAEAAKAA